MCGGAGCGGSGGCGGGLLKRNCGLYPGPGVDPRGVSCGPCFDSKPKNCNGPPYGRPNANYYPCGFAGRNNRCRGSGPWDTRHLNHAWNYNKIIAHCSHHLPGGYDQYSDSYGNEEIQEEQKNEEKKKEDEDDEKEDEEEEPPTEDEISKCFERIRKFIMMEAGGEAEANDGRMKCVRDLDNLKSFVLGNTRRESC